MKYRCLNCDTTEEDNWENVDAYRIKPSGMSVCKTCGYITYPERLENKNLKEYYRKDYRKPPTHANLFTGMRKLNYHASFLDDLFNDWDKADDKGKDKEIFEIGAAYGIVLHWIKRQFPECNVNGTEWTTSYKRNAFHEYGINLVDDFDDTKKYDLIMSYKVAEHQIDVDKDLRKYAECLKENGKLYISVPQWFGELNNFGIAGFDIEYYYHPDHINCWTREQFENLLSRAGLKIVKTNHTMYDSTYLCERDDSLMNTDVIKYDYKEVIKTLDNIKKASDCMDKSDFVGAIESYPNFPMAHVNRYELNRKKFHDMGFDKIQKEVIDFGLKCCPESAEIVGMAADIYMRYDKWNEALKMIDKALAMKPGLEKFMISAANILFKLAKLETDKEQQALRIEEARMILRQCKNTSQQAVPQCTDMIYQANANLPTPMELNAT